ncbi:MAG: NAD(P)-dependent oxidoreductase [Nocardioidaceae bacterium]|nr:MAG: NAD(P)-dependent oxidoreductase [Nocardioidaceae bacterium]
MRVAVTGSTGVLGRSVVPALIDGGHDVIALARTTERGRIAESLGATARVGTWSDVEAFAAQLDDCDAVCNLASHVPVGYAKTMPWSRRATDALRTEGVRRVLAAARSAGIRRVIQESASCLYADGGDEWINERSSLCINRATEPISVGESLVQEFTCESRTGVVLRFGAVVCNEDQLHRVVRTGHVIGAGSPDSWAHVVHQDDVGPAVVAALTAPSGVYNVGADPVRRAELCEIYADAIGRKHFDPMGSLLAKLSGERSEPLTRSLRVSSSSFHNHTGWIPRHPEFDVSWLLRGITPRSA